MLRSFLCSLLLALFIFPTGLSARHIIGGVITYENLGGGNYRFVMKMYRDCNCVDCADFDQIASIGIYNCGDGGQSCASLGQGNFFQRLDVPLQSVEQVAEPDYPCLIPPDVCVQEGTYEFTANLPLSSLSYHISYQRCCRNVTISNIVAPQNSGATFTVEVTPEAQELGNNSPVFNDFPPTIICAGQPLVFDHSASDSDGDQLLYEFCPPFLGGGPVLMNPGYTTCEGAQPTPSCPPPYDNVNFRAPTFTPAQPMGGDPVVSIDPLTGVITGTPNVLGQYVVGVCVSEFRDGVLLSRVFRDFQFNVASCDPVVVADIQEDAKIGDQEYLVNSCGNETISFLNQSFQENFIDDWVWEFDINGQTQSFTEWSPTVTFPGVGEYFGQLKINPGTDCGDTATIYVNVYPEIKADFSYAYDTCVAGVVEFTDLSETGSCCLTGWNWDFGDGNNSSRQSPDHLYRTPGEIPVTLTVRDTNQCEDQRTQVIEYFPVPNLIVVSPSSFLGCQPAEIFFNNLSFPIDTTYDILWDFGDGGTSTDISPTYTYENPGNYTVNVEITSPIGCETDTVFDELITVLESPVADFSFTPSEPSNLNNTITFSDLSQRGVGWTWDFGDGSRSQQRSPIHTYRDTGIYVIQQVVVHPSGCTDTLEQIIDIFPEVRYYLPNAFTPNNDSVNDFYKGVGVMTGATNFSLTIWNRWGEMIFETDDPEASWNGRKFNTGKESPNGVYVVLVKYNDPRGNPFEIKGYATLIR